MISTKKKNEISNNIFICYKTYLKGLDLGLHDKPRFLKF